MKTFVLLLTALICYTYTQAQTGTVKGTLKDSSQTIAFESATVVLYNLKDSSVVETTFSNTNGQFEFKKIGFGAYRLYITSVQFLSTIKDFVLDSANTYKNFGIIALRKGSKLEDVTVVAQNPIRIATDTVEYKADAFKTRPNAMVEDLLKRLPGVQVDKSGNVTAQGQTVTKVLVDGKPFFGNDPKTATKNLPANIVDKVQVIDRKSDQSQFTGFDDGTTEKVINITIKKDKKKGFFGRANTGVGTNGRYENNLSFNRFNNGLQLSVIGQANNINQEGFSFQDIMDFNGSGGFGGGRNADAGGGGGGGMMGGGGMVTMTRGGGGMFGGMNIGGMPTGLRTTQAGGINFSNAFNKKFTLSSSYFYNRSYNLTENSSSRQTFASDTNFNNINNQSSIDRSWRSNHRLNIDMDWNIDSFNSVLIRPSLTYIDKETQSSSNSDVFALNKNLKSQIIQRNTTNSSQLNLSGTVLWRHKTRKKGRTLSMRLNGGQNQTDGDGINFNEQDFYVPIPRINIVDQINRTDNGSNTFNLRTTYTEPLSKTRILELYHSIGRNFNQADRKAFTKNGSGEYTVLDTTLSNVFDNTFNNQQLGFNVQTKQKKYDYTLGLAVQKANLTSVNVLKRTTLEQNNVYNFFPTARLNFNFGKSRNLRFNYRGSTNQPSANQLQPVVDNTNPLSIRQGNPALKQEFTNNLNVFYNKFNFITMKTFLVFANITATSNKIVDSVRNIGPGIQFRRPGNVNGAYNAISNVSFGFPIKALKTTNLNLSSTLLYNRDVNVIDAKNNTTKTFTYTQTLNINHNYKDKLDVMLSGMGSYNNTRYSLTNTANNEFYNFTSSVDVSYTFKNNLTVQSDIDNTIYTGRSQGFNQNFTLWNASISKLFLKDKSLEAKFTAFDILKQNRAINRTVQETYIEDSRSNVLTQYFMVSLRYNLNKFGGKGARSFSMPKLPGMRQMGNMRIGL